MIVTFTNGETTRMPYPQCCTGFVATKLELEPSDVLAMAKHAATDPEQFQAAMAQLEYRFESQRLAAATRG